MRKVGGIYFWSVGSVGGSFYRRKPCPKQRAMDSTLIAAAINFHLWISGVALTIAWVNV